MQNRMAIKNLESLLVDNQRKAVNGEKIIQFIYGADGADPRFLERIKFPTMKKELDFELFEKEFHGYSSVFEKEFRTPEVQKLLDTEFAQLEADRQFYTNLFINMEQVSNKVYSDTLQMPVNINRIIEDILYNMELKKFQQGKFSALNPVRAIGKIKELCETITYCLINKIQEKKRSPIPPHMKHCTTLLKVLIRSYLNMASLTRRGITNEALDLIVEKIKSTYSSSLISYGKVVGILAAQSISEPMTQMVLDSHHFSGTASTKKKGMFRIKEILSARPTEKMKACSMTVYVKAQFAKDKAKVQEIANHIEMLSLGKFVRGWKIFYEKYGNPIHPSFIHEKELIKEFEKYNANIKVPSDLANWCIRFTLDKSKLIEKQMRMDIIYHRLRHKYPATYIVYSTDNSDNIIMRIYVRNSISKKAITLSQMKELVADISSTIIRGVKNIKAAYVQEKIINSIQPDGSIKGEKIWHIFCDGTNMKEILEHPDIDPDTIQSDSIVEMYEICGITAARQKIIDELKHQVEGSSHRHYAIYGDQMTFTGQVTSVDRFGSARRGSSIMLRISDASPISVVEESAINMFSDDLNGVSPPIMLGKNPKIGDLYNRFALDSEFIAENVKDLDQLFAEL
jgi:hypothetical protein